MNKTFEVNVSFFVEASTAEDAERIARAELNSPPVQHLIGDTVGYGQVHEGQTVERDGTQD